MGSQQDSLERLLKAKKDREVAEDRKAAEEAGRKAAEHEWAARQFKKR